MGEELVHLTLTVAYHGVSTYCTPFFDDSCNEFSATLFACKGRDKDGLHDPSSIILPPQKVAVNLRDGWVPSMCSQMGVSASSGQYVPMGLKSFHFFPAIDLLWIMPVRRTTSLGEKFQVIQVEQVSSIVC
jgi:hypothetical protein